MGYIRLGQELEGRFRGARSLVVVQPAPREEIDRALKHHKDVVHVFVELRGALPEDEWSFWRAVLDVGYLLTVEMTEDAHLPPADLRHDPRLCVVARVPEWASLADYVKAVDPDGNVRVNAVCGGVYVPVQRYRLDQPWWEA